MPWLVCLQAAVAQAACSAAEAATAAAEQRVQEAKATAAALRAELQGRADQVCGLTKWQHWKWDYHWTCVAAEEVLTASVLLYAPGGSLHRCQNVMRSARSLSLPALQHSSQSVLSLLLLQAKELQAAQKAVDESAAQAASAQQLLSGVQADKASLAQQVKKLTAEKASLLEQLGSSAGDIDMLQVR